LQSYTITTTILTGFSALKIFLIADEGMYFADVTTYGNLPLFDAGGIISGWEDDGLTGFEYDFSVTRVSANSAVTEPSTLSNSVSPVSIHNKRLAA